MTAETAQVVVVGGGAIGLCAAIALADRGCGVTLVERGLPGAANSTMTGGGIRHQFGTEANIALSRLAQPWWDTFAERFGVDPAFQPIGYLFLARSAAELSGLRSAVALQNAHGVDSVLLDGGEIARRWPALGGRGFVGAGFRQRDGWANHHRIVDGLFRGCLARGVRVRVGTECLEIESARGRVTGVRTTHGAIGADAVLLAAGPWGAGLLADLGLALPVAAHRHELLIVEPARTLPPGLPWLIGVADQVHLRSDTPGRALVGGFLGHDEATDPDAFSQRADPGWAAAVLGAAADLFGVIDADARICHGWAGLYPSTPDRHPIVDRLMPGLYAAMGFSGTGLMHAPAAGLLAAELIVDGAIASVHAGWFSAARFAEPATLVERSGF